MRHLYEDKTHLFMSLESFFQVLCLWGGHVRALQSSASSEGSC